MNLHHLPIASSLLALLLASCASLPSGQTPPTTAAPASPGVNAPSAQHSETSASAISSFKETKRLDRELGKNVVPYPFDTCAVLQRPFGPEGPKHRRIYKRQEVLFCCTPCVHAFDANPEPFMPRILAAVEATNAEVNLPSAPINAREPR